MKKMSDFFLSDFFLSENFQFLVVKISIYLNRRVFVMVGLGGALAKSTGDQEVAGSTPTSRQDSFVEIDHEIFSTFILSLR